MIHKIVLKDFLSHEDTEVVFAGATTAIVGENGHGKSALLEAIPYAYFGLGRETKEGMSRINGDGSHRVEVWEDNGTMVARGRKASGAGFCEVRVDGELVSKGKEADDWIVNHLGVVSDTFMLTAFFGLGDSYTDKLLGVTPASRLEALQDLAQVGPYRKFHARAKALIADSGKVFDVSSAKVEGAETALEGLDGLQDALSLHVAASKKAHATYEVLKKERSELQREEEVYHEFIKERERVSVERRSAKSELDRLMKSREESIEFLERSKTLIADGKTTIKDLKASELPDLDVLSSDQDRVKADIAAKETALNLHEVALSLPVDEAACPLCEQSVTDDIVSKWETAIESIRVDILALQDKRDSVTATYAKTKASLARLDSVESTVTSLLRESAEIKEELTTTVKEISRVESELSKKDDRFFYLTDKLGSEYQGITQKIDDVVESMDACQGTWNSAEGSMAEIKAALKRAEVATKVVSDAKRAMEQARVDGRVALHLREAWSRYGIPLQLVDRLNARIEERATAMYQEFDNGRVEVREVEDRGKPGVQFYLVDRKGDRTYNQLSMGEKVMFFISIRVAIAYIVAEDSPVAVDFLVLDEAMGNLSPNRRDDMVRLVNKALRKMFPQVILVTHTVIPEIFDRSIEVSMQNDVSHVRVL